MDRSFIHESAKIVNSRHGIIRAYRNVEIKDSTLGDYCSVGDDTSIVRSVINDNVAINRRSYINDSTIGSYTYTGINTTINYSSVGSFCSVGRNVDIGGLDHDYRRLTTLPSERFSQLSWENDTVERTDKPDLCTIGNDVWIAAGVTILHSASVADGAVIGAGSVVTHDVPAYAIAVGSPARVIGYRCEERLIRDLLDIAWWNWPKDKLDKYGKILSEREISEETIEWLKGISEEC